MLPNERAVNVPRRAATRISCVQIAEEKWRAMIVGHITVGSRIFDGKDLYTVRYFNPITGIIKMEGMFTRWHIDGAPPGTHVLSCLEEIVFKSLRTLNEGVKAQ